MILLLNLFIYFTLANVFFAQKVDVQTDIENSHQNPEWVEVIGWYGSREKIEITDVPSEILGSKLHETENTTFYIKDEVKYFITYSGHNVYYFKTSPDKKHLAFFYHPERNTLKDVAIVVMNLTTKETIEIYRKSIRTSYWTWEGNDNITVRYNAGTGLLYAYKIDIHTADVIDEYFEYIDPSWNN